MSKKSPNGTTPRRGAIPLLRLSTAPMPLRTVKIDGTAYPLRDVQVFSLAQHHRLEHGGLRLDALWARDSMSEAESQELRDLTRDLSQLVLDAPAAILDKLSDLQRIQILRSFAEISRPAAVTE